MGVKGLIFDRKEFAVFDGPGIRTTVFLKGCPLHCAWCHNPEGLSFEKELMVSTKGCLNCGRCLEVCEYGGREKCRLCGKCVAACGLRLRKICGTEYTADELVAELLKDKDFLRRNNGGVTFSGGEALAQPYFMKEILQKLPGIHKAVETSGYCDTDTFCEIVRLLDYVIMDIKLADDRIHKKYTGVSNKRILANLEYLKTGEKPYTIRVPLIPGISDTDENLSRTAKLLKGARNLEMVELLPYHAAAGAKYPMVNREYKPEFDTQREVNSSLVYFERQGLPCRVL